MTEDRRDAVQDVLEKLRCMKIWEDGWNGFAAKAPTADTLYAGYAWILTMRSEVENSGQRWWSPHTTADVDGEVVLEWQVGPRRLIIHVHEDEVTYIKDTGTEVGSVMLDGDASTPESKLALWAWLTDRGETE